MGLGMGKSLFGVAGELVVVLGIVLRGYPS
jgi:hypothetical protein